MALFHTTVLDNQIKALPTVDTASGSIASFNTDLTENLVDVKCQIVAQPCDSLTLYHNSINLWNEQWEKGVISSGVFIPSGDRVCSKNFIRVKPSTRLYIASSIAWVFFYQNANENSYISNGQTPINTPANCNYIKFYTTSSYGQIYQNDLFVSYENISYTPFNGVYIPFGETLTSGGSFDVLSGILTRSDDTTKQLSANYIHTNNGENNIWCDTGDTEVKYLLTVGKAIS